MPDNDKLVRLSTSGSMLSLRPTQELTEKCGVNAAEEISTPYSDSETGMKENLISKISITLFLDQEV